MSDKARQEVARHGFERDAALDKGQRYFGRLCDDAHVGRKDHRQADANSTAIHRRNHDWHRGAPHHHGGKGGRQCAFLVYCPAYPQVLPSRTFSAPEDGPRHEPAAIAVVGDGHFARRTEAIRRATLADVEVGTGTECFASAGEHDCADTRVSIGKLKHKHERGAHRRIERVEPAQACRCQIMTSAIAPALLYPPPPYSPGGAPLTLLADRV